MQALIICSTISAAPRLCSRACWYRSLCFSISFSWDRVRTAGAGEPRLSSPAFPPHSLTPHPCAPCSSTHWFLPSAHKLPLSFGTEVRFVSCNYYRVGHGTILTWAHRSPRGEWIKSRRSVHLNEEKSNIFMLPPSNRKAPLMEEAIRHGNISQICGCVTSKNPDVPLSQFCLYSSLVTSSSCWTTVQSYLID